MSTEKAETWFEGSLMLTCYGHEVRLPQNNLAYLGFRLAALDTLCQLDACHDSGDDISSYLAEVPVLEQAAPVVQVDLLAGAWRRHQAPEHHKASLRNAGQLSSKSPRPGPSRSV